MRIIDADALRKCFEVPHELKCGIQAGMDEYALKCIDEQPTIAASPWRRVEESPKEERRIYLVYTDTGYMCSCRWTNNVYGLGESDRWGWSMEDVPQFQKVTHWMPIEPPKEDA